MMVIMKECKYLFVMLSGSCWARYPQDEPRPRHITTFNFAGSSLHPSLAFAKNMGDILMRVLALHNASSTKELARREPRL